MIQFLIDIYNYLFHKPSPTQNIANDLTLYSVMIYKKLQKHNNKINKYNRNSNIYKDNLTFHTIDYSQFKSLYDFLQYISLTSYDIICISNIVNELHTYTDGNKYVVIYVADFIAQIMDMYYVADANCIILSRLPIIEHKTYIVDELNHNFILQIKIHINDFDLFIYNVNINASIFDYINHTNTFISSILENNYNNIPYIVTGIYNCNYGIYNVLKNIFTGNKYRILFNSILQTEIIGNSSGWHLPIFFYINSIWCHHKIYIEHQTYCNYNGIKLNIKVTQ